MLKQVGNYTLTERIGRGALSRIYRALDREGRLVAIKASTTRAEPGQLDGLQKDLVAAAGVLHPNVVAIHDLGFEDEFPYVAMELAEGRDFDGLRQSATSLPLRERISAMLQVGAALEAAHEREVLHLDVRPSKIMWSGEGASKLLGLGMGRFSYDPARVTGCGYLIGSPLYMSPERLNAIDTAGVQCDIWSFGVTFYELLAGKHPFYDDDGERMIGNIIVNLPMPLTGVPASLNNVILRALEKDPANRYRNFAELLAETRPIMSELQLEESEMLMAQALEESDSGHWHEARRLARKLRGPDTEDAPDPLSFELSDHEPEAAAPSEAPVLAEVPIIAAAVAAPFIAEAVETPEPISLPVPEPIVPRLAPSPERPVTKISPAVKNGAVRGQNGSPAMARLALTPPANGVRTGVSATGGRAGASTVETRTRTTSRRVSKPVRRQSPIEAGPEYRQLTSTSSERALVAQPAVRVLEFTESRGLPWGKMAGVAAVGLLAAGLSFLWLQQPHRLITAVNASDDSKALSPAGRVIKPVSAGQPGVSAFSPTISDSQPAVAPDPAAASPIEDDSPVTPPRAFDPKSLVLRKMPARRPVSPMASLKPPSLTGNVFVADSASFPPLVFSPPPAPRELTSSPAVAASEATVPAAVQTAHVSVTHIGSSFAEPTLVYSIQPVYPSTALQRKTQGIVRFQATIAKDGSLKNLQLVSGDPLLNVAAKQAVSQWRYRPATLNGEPVEVTQGIIVKFNLDR